MLSQNCEVFRGQGLQGYVSVVIGLKIGWL